MKGRLLLLSLVLANVVCMSSVCVNGRAGCRRTWSDSDGGISVEAKQEVPSSGQVVRIAARVIRDIGEKHARFAITLAEMNVYGISRGYKRLYWTPIRLMPSDVDAFLNKGTHRTYFKRYDEEVRRLNLLIRKGELSGIVYSISTKQPEQGSWLIRMETDLQPTVDPPYSALEIQASGSRVTWQIR